MQFWILLPAGSQRCNFYAFQHLAPITVRQVGTGGGFSPLTLPSLTFTHIISSACSFSLSPYCSLPLFPHFVSLSSLSSFPLFLTLSSPHRSLRTHFSPILSVFAHTQRHHLQALFLLVTLHFFLFSLLLPLLLFTPLFVSFFQFDFD